MKSASTTPTALLLIDIQQGFRNPSLWGGPRSTPTFESNIIDLLQAARSWNALRSQSQPQTTSQPIKIIHIHHHSIDPGSALHPSYVLPKTSIRGVEPADYAIPTPGEPVLIKSVNSAFIGTDLEARLRAAGIRQLVVAGLTTDHCVSTSVRMAANLKVLGDEVGPDADGVVLARDGTAAHAKGGFEAETVHAVQLASLDGEFAEVKTTREIIDAIMR